MDTAALTSSGRVRGTAVVVALVGVVVLCWMLLVPQGGQPDEHSHIVRSAALVRNAEAAPDLEGAYLLPDRYVVADPGCYAFQPTFSAKCTVLPDVTGDTVVLATRATDYPWGGHLVFGVAGLAPGLAPIWWGRLAAAAIGTALLSAGLLFARRSRSVGAGALLLGLTPMAWAIVPALNPSSIVTAGAAALWIGLLVVPRADALPAAHRWLIALAWVATVLPRRDGMIWACLITMVVAGLTGCDLVALARRLGAAAVTVIVAATLATIAWGLTSGARASSLVVVAPIALVIFELVRHRWPSIGRDRAVIVWGSVIGALVAGIAWVGLVSTRPGGWDTDLVVTVIGQTDENMIEAIGVLGWLDTSIPYVAVFAWLVLVGMLVAGAVVANRRALVAAGLLLALSVVTSWTFELLQGNVSGTYWQGRYSLPLLIGLPLVLAYRDDRSAPTAAGGSFPDFGTIVGVGGLVLLNVAAWAAARRWGVGTLGSYLPWRWDTPVQPFPVLLLLIVHGLATVALGWVLLGADAERR